MLIDRSDELSVLFERSHALEARLQAGTIGLQQLESEVRGLQRVLEATRQAQQPTADEASGHQWAFDSLTVKYAAIYGTNCEVRSYT
jgi:hypothetical protein